MIHARFSSWNNKQNRLYIGTYLFLRPIPHNHTVTAVDQIFHNTATHDTESEKPEFQGRRQDVFLLESLRERLHI